MIAEAIRKVGNANDTEALVKALEGMKIQCPEDPPGFTSYIDPKTHQIVQIQAIGTTVKNEKFPPAKFVFAGGDDGMRIGVALDSMVANGCIISGGRVERSILSNNVRINSYSSVMDSIIMEGVDIGRNAKIRRAIIDKDVKIPSGTEIGYDLEEDKKRFTVTESGLVVVAKGTVIER
jgi:ADP-glucose pyrophosphorylase